MNSLKTEFPLIDFEERVQAYKNVESHEEAILAGADIVELKFDGWWGRLVAQGGQAKVYSRQGQLKHEASLDIPDCTLIGEFLKGTQRVVSGGEGAAGNLVVFDVLEMEGRCAAHLPWTARNRMVKGLEQYGQWIQPVKSFGIRASGSLWNAYVEGGNAEGLVYKRSSDRYVGSTVWRMKKEFSMDYILISPYEGKGKHVGKLGGVNGGLWVDGKVVQRCKVGGGFNDAEREEIWNNFEKYAGRVLEVTGWQIFESGAMRHPNAARDPLTGLLKWRDDKEPQDCYWEK